MQGFILKQSDSQIIFWFIHDVVAYGNSSLFFMFKTYEKPINSFFNVGLGHMHILPTMTTVGTYCILIIPHLRILQYNTKQKQPSITRSCSKQLLLS